MRRDGLGFVADDPYAHWVSIIYPSRRPVMRMIP